MKNYNGMESKRLHGRQESPLHLRQLIELRNQVFFDTFGHAYETCVYFAHQGEEIGEQHKWHLKQFDMLVMGQR